MFVKRLEIVEYGKGPVYVAEKFETVLSCLDQIRKDRNMSIVLLAHAKVEKFKDPRFEAYDRYEPDLHKLIAPVLMEWADEVLFTTQEVATIKTDEGFGRERIRAAGDGQSVLYTREQPSFLAKRRLSLPDSMPLNAAEYLKYIRNAAEERRAEFRTTSMEITDGTTVSAGNAHEPSAPSGTASNGGPDAGAGSGQPVNAQLQG